MAADGPMELRRLAYDALMQADVAAKLDAVAELLPALQDNGVLIDPESAFAEFPVPGRPVKPDLVAPKDVPRRGLGTLAGRAALLHAVAHIEFNAINLALDAVQRFGGMPLDFYRDWVSVAIDEARHFQLLQTRLSALGFGYGAFMAHNGLWEMAEKTRDSCLSRMALVPRLLEARGLDVTPGMIHKLRQVQDDESAALLEVILAEEVGHVAIGTQWFNYCCRLQNKNPETVFIELLKIHAKGSVRGPYNLEARVRSGFTDYEMREISLIGQR